MGLTPINYVARRQMAFEEIKDGALLLLSPSEVIRNRDMYYKYRQESFLHYLTGFEEPESALLLVSTAEGNRAVMFLRERDKQAELWNGKRLGVENAVKTLSLDEAHPVKELWQRLPNLLKGCNRLYYQLGQNKAYDEQAIDCLMKERRLRARTVTTLLPILDTDLVAGKLRLKKSKEEVERMKAAAVINEKGFEKIFAAVRPGMNEQEAYGIVVGEFLRHGAEMEAYNAIVAGGVNACCLHYHENNAPLNNGELLLVDAGCQFQYYACDVTRTFPIGKKFSPEQKDVYQCVLDAQLAAINEARVGSTLNDVHDRAVEKLVQGLLEMKLLQGSKSEIVEKKLYKDLYPHSTSHWIGMDVHDVGDYTNKAKPVLLEEGMYFSVEPGLYFDPQNDKIPDAFKGIGVRIEDDIFVSRSGPEVFTDAIVKKVAELENRF